MLFSWQGQKDLVSPAGSVGASALRAEVSTGDPHPLDTLRVPIFKVLNLKKGEIARFAHGEIICSANCDF